MLTKTTIPFGAYKTGKELKHERIRVCSVLGGNNNIVISFPIGRADLRHLFYHDK